MRRCLIILGLLLHSAAPLAAEGPFDTTSVEVYFSPKGGCTEAVVAELETAKKSILVQAYALSSGSSFHGIVFKDILPVYCLA